MTASVDTGDHDGLCAAVDQGVADLGRLDAIVANAGICSPSPWDQISASDFQDVVAWLASDQSSFVTAAAFSVDAGVSQS